MGTDCDGEGKQRSGGLAVLWDSTLEVEITSMSRNHVDMIIQENEEGKHGESTVFMVIQTQQINKDNGMGSPKLFGTNQKHVVVSVWRF
ncbi:hypothetical protein AHAS_Ahas12G0131400 [Arachis hypogaea]